MTSGTDSTRVSVATSLPWPEEDTLRFTAADFVILAILSLVGGLIGGMLMVVMVAGA